MKLMFLFFSCFEFQYWDNLMKLLMSYCCILHEYSTVFNFQRRLLPKDGTTLHVSLSQSVLQHFRRLQGVTNMALRILSKTKLICWKEFHVSFPGALERVGNDDAVLDLSEDVGRIFSITSDNLTINFWPPVLLAAVVVISEWGLLETFYRILHLRSSFSKGVGASQSIFISLL